MRYLLLLFKGIAMGAADVVPGVSGGTIAFITGIYEELVNSIKNVDLAALKMLLTGKFGQFWRKINGNFLVSVVGGIAISIFSLAKLMTYLLDNYPIGTWSFFFGLIIASSLLVSKEIDKWSVGTIICMLLGITVAYLITSVTPATTPDNWWFIILTGAIAICAMILPGISGAFILLLMNKYQYMMEAVAELHIGTILLFVLGAIIGIIAFSHILSWLLKNYKTVTVATLTGFMLGSLNKLWPWKEVLETYTDSHGKLHPLIEKNVSPGQFELVSGSDAQMGIAIMMCVAGILLIAVIELAGNYLRKRA